ncbi:MAG: citrate lyase holo-[Clostridia bacterium]|nr:citrate lyase holo-[acyl-carrier protein] synthase [Clostridia bacterium]
HFAHSIREKTGCEAIFCVEGDAKKIKRRLCALEDSAPIGRLWDIDVLLGMGEKVSRTDLGLPPRKCLLCGEDAPVCARSRAHSVDALAHKTNEIINAHFREEFIRRIARQAQRALLTEVAISPKPGLVDRENNGAHSDMDVFTFMDSACALRDYFESCARIGMAHSKSSAAACFDALRVPGLLAEDAMKDATRGVNTHKGAIFSLGIFCAALGLGYAGGKMQTTDAFSCCAMMTREQMGREIDRIKNREHDPQTFGEQYLRTAASGGVRAEAAEGFPSVRNTGLPRLKQALAAGLSLNDAGLCALVALMSCVDDTNAVHRGNPEGANAMKHTALTLDREITAALESGSIQGFDLIGRMRGWDTELTRKNISPGGCADMLALTLLAAFMEESV